MDKRRQDGVKRGEFVDFLLFGVWMKGGDLRFRTVEDVEIKMTNKNTHVSSQLVLHLLSPTLNVPKNGVIHGPPGRHWANHVLFLLTTRPLGCVAWWKSRSWEPVITVSIILIVRRCPAKPWW